MSEWITMDDRIENILSDINSLSAIDRARLISRLNGKQRTHISHRSAVPKVIEHLNEHKWITAPVAFNEGYLDKKLSSSEFEKLKRKKLLNCHKCNSLKVDKNLMAPSINKKLNIQKDKELKKLF